MKTIRLRPNEKTLYELVSKRTPDQYGGIERFAYTGSYEEDPTYVVYDIDQGDGTWLAYEGKDWSKACVIWGKILENRAHGMLKGGSDPNKINWKPADAKARSLAQ